MARLLGVSRQGYDKHANRTGGGLSARERADAALAERISHHHTRSRGTYGAPRIQVDLRQMDGIRAGRNRITRLMRAAGLVGAHRRHSANAQLSPADYERRHTAALASAPHSPSLTSEAA
ncbi:IS3 family transposase [Lipingzhangella sp. LS1_29]|uniref:IS3 family transposase n=2 Tax=Lipingzhangella rawalii TaxID=2055835 RepID=A0ABU2H3Q6_9ACTN|nr:IS3 family transposase [Lipingzhangella rawalii]